MSHNTDIPVSERVHISFWGRCNSGKSSLINALTGQSVAIVSDIAGTTTDPLLKTMELPGVGATVLIDTAGLDDTSVLGQQRIGRSRMMLDRTDIAIILFHECDISIETELADEMRRRGIPTVCVISRCDILHDTDSLEKSITSATGIKPLCVSALTGEGTASLRERIASMHKTEDRLLTYGLCEPGDTVLLVMPQDRQAPKGRIIKPQIQVLRELLDRGCNVLCCTTGTMQQALTALSSPPQLVITDSQAFASVYGLTPKDTRLTSFSILFARYKGDINEFIKGAQAIDRLSSSSRILIAEACTHVPQHEDIGRVKLPNLLRRHFGDSISIDIVGGNDFPDDLSGYGLIIHCGACMFNRRHVMSRISRAKAQNIPVTNYGVAIAALTGILDKVVY
ncbi:MAG: [Muribaculaceae bacterium]|nr:[FeFe] hydrogenase H-cluster maturation GTPase HydF [Muribaculaceae bacterium]